MKRKATALIVLAVAVALAVVAAGYAAAVRSSASDTFVFGAEGDPTLLDGPLVSDGPSGRVVSQMFEGMVGLKPGTTKVVPALATSWTTSKNGLGRSMMRGLAQAFDLCDERAS